jgi:hypothetical protein
MSKLRLGIVESDKPVRVSIKVPAPVYRNLLAYADALAAATKQDPPRPEKIIPAMIEQFMATDRGFAKFRRKSAGELSEEQL